MNISELLAKAERASPRVSQSRKEWATLYPVIEKLREKGLPMLASVNWLIEQKAISKDDASRAYQAFHKIKQRSSRK